MEEETNNAVSASDAVRGALTKSEQTLGATVLLVNLALGAWFIANSDFSEVRPNHRSAPAEDAEHVQPPVGLAYGALPPGLPATVLPMEAEGTRLADSRTP